MFNEYMFSGGVQDFCIAVLISGRKLKVVKKKVKKNIGVRISETVVSEPCGISQFSKDLRIENWLEYS
ncbi:hypothetical protein [Methanosarcina sp.]|jgi:large-conductance mechanosensitive channel|uniref:hypothetical protein n=1 Tax=Methanosarcina sp. TaxID=2213 RepID=UPI002C29DF13|nr:hypothetical protein [Methanosarcina sp.]HOW15534.1 hypothetical protein [Methanosarcina sp.]